jgi:AraC-like DNA-binding protein
MRTRLPPGSPAAPESTTRADGVLRFERLPAGVGIRLRGIGWSALQPGGWQWRLSKPYWVFYRNDRDGAEVTLGGLTVPLRTGRGYLIPPRQPYRTSCTAALRHLYVYLELSGLGPHSAAALGRILEVPAAIDLGWLDEVAAQAGRALGDAEQLRLLGVVLATLRGLLPDGPPASGVDRALAPALAHLARHFAQPLAVADLAQRCRLRENAFTARFRAAYGTTAVQYLRRLRAERAATLLSTTSWGTSRIARACGFGNRTYLARVFREVIGITPGEYRHAQVFERHVR